MKIKALSLWQPWASLIALGAKRYETRSWVTSYRGPLLICASKKWSAEIEDLLLVEPFKSALNDLIQTDGIRTGVAVCVAELVDTFEMCDGYMRRTGTNDEIAYEYPDGNEKAFGLWVPGRFAWKLENIRTFNPFAVTGRQGLFEVDVNPDLLEAD